MKHKSPDPQVYTLTVDFTHDEEKQLIDMLYNVGLGGLVCFTISGQAEFARDFLRELGESI